jgi:cytochrome c oxidase subunit 2
MIGRLYVQTPAEYEKWVSVTAPPVTDAQVAGGAAAAAPSMADRGKALFTQYACNTCHMSGLPVQLGPKLGGLAGKKRSVFTDLAMTQKTEITADDEYIRQSIAVSNTTIVEGFQPVMPPFKGIINDADINALVAYVKSIPDGQ